MVDIFEKTELFNGPRVFKGVRQVNGLAEGFDESLLEDGYIYFVRTSEDKKYGYVYLNGKRYGESKPVIDCGTY
jgi:hypothetical protein